MEFATLGAFAVIGIEARTSNALEMSFEGVIPEQWGRFMREDLAGKIPNRADSEIIALYTDYESDDSGMYTFVLGVRVTCADEVPEGMVLRNVPPARYAIFPSARGPVARIVFQTWQKIWKEPDLNRSYQADFEVYGAEAANPSDCRIDIYVGVR
jgi:predicted transcriptional regulator YdeE